MTGGFGSSGGHRADGLRSEKHRDRRDFGDVGGKVATSDEDDDRHRASRGSRQSHKTSGSQQGESDYGLGFGGYGVGLLIDSCQQGCARGLTVRDLYQDRDPRYFDQDRGWRMGPFRGLSLRGLQKPCPFMEYGI